MTELKDRVPRANEDDPEDVSLALETARALAAAGDAREVVRWVRRAAEAAGEGGLDHRAVQLAGLAADLSTELSVTPSLAPQPAQHVYVAASSDDLDDDFSDKTIVDALPTAARMVASGRQGPSSAPPADGPASAPAGVKSAPPGVAPANAPALVALDSRNAFRVAVLVKPDGELFGKALKPGESAPPGTREALLVMLGAEATKP